MMMTTRINKYSKLRVKPKRRNSNKANKRKLNKAMESEFKIIPPKRWNKHGQI